MRLELMAQKDGHFDHLIKNKKINYTISVGIAPI
jgi:hypothetical protein